MTTYAAPAEMRAARSKAFDLIKERSYREGDFVLASGRKSKFYLDLKPTMFHPDGATLLGELVLEKISTSVSITSAAWPSAPFRW